MFSCTSTNTSMSAKRRTRLLVSGRLRMPEMASARGRLLLPATSFMRVAPRLRLASRVSKGRGGDTRLAMARSSNWHADAQTVPLGASQAAPPYLRCCGLVDGFVRRRQELENTHHSRARCLIGHTAPGAIEL